MMPWEARAKKNTQKLENQDPWTMIPVITILGDPGAVSGGRKKSKRARKNSGEKNSQERKEDRPH